MKSLVQKYIPWVSMNRRFLSRHFVLVSRHLDTGRRIIVSIALMLAVLLVAASCTSDDGSGSSSQRQSKSSVIKSNDQEVIIPDLPGDNTLVWVHNLEPNSLHADTLANEAAPSAQWLQQGMLEGLFGIDSTLSYYPELLAGEPTVETSGETMTVKYRLRADLKWSDGENLTSEDVQYTHNILTEGCTKHSDGSVVDNSREGCVYEIPGLLGYEYVNDFTVLNETEFVISFAEFYPDWRSLYSRIYAQHAFGATAAEVNQNLLRFETESGEKLPSSGPLKFDSWEKGVKLDLVRNDSYHGSQNPEAQNKGKPSVERVRMLFFEEKAQVATLKAGSAHFVMATATSGLDGLQAQEGIDLEWAASDLFDHVGMDLTNKHLKKPQVREAIAHAIDKNAMLEEVFVPYFGERVTSLGNSYWLTHQPQYVDNQEKYATANNSEAQRLLTEAGYSQNADGLVVDEEGSPLSLTFMTQSGDALREKQQKVLAEQLEAVGFTIKIVNLPGDEFYGTAASSRGPFSEKEGDESPLWDLALFGWFSGPWPGSQSSAYGDAEANNSANNIYGFSNEAFDTAANACSSELEAAKQSECFNALDRYATTLTGESGLFVLPLVQKPPLLAYKNDLLEQRPVVVGVDAGGPLVNVGDFELK